MRRFGLAAVLAVLGTLGASVPASAGPPAQIPAHLEPPVLGLDVRYLDADGHAKILRVEDFPRR